MNADWIEDCLEWRGRVLDGHYTHWCFEWDGLPMDETCPEWPCDCAVGEEYTRTKDLTPTPSHATLTHGGSDDQE